MSTCMKRLTLCLTTVWLAVVSSAVHAQTAGDPVPDAAVIKCLQNGMTWTILLDAGEKTYHYLVLGSKSELAGRRTFTPGDQTFPKSLSKSQCASDQAMKLNLEIAVASMGGGDVVSPLKRFLSSYEKQMTGSPALAALYATTAPLDPGKEVLASGAKTLSPSELERLIALMK